MTLLALLGFILSLRHGRAEQRLLALYPLVFVFGLSLSPLHWARWTVPILPVIGLSGEI